MSATYFTDAALELLRQTQAANMPDRVAVFTRTLTRAAGGVTTETFALDRIEPCRLSRAQATEVARGTTTGERRTYIVARPYDVPPLDGTERLVVLGGNGANRRRFSVTLRSIGARPPQSFDTVQLTDATADGVAPIVVATSDVVGAFTSTGMVSLS